MQQNRLNSLRATLSITDGVLRVFIFVFWCHQPKEPIFQCRVLKRPKSLLIDQAVLCTSFILRNNSLTFRGGSLQSSIFFKAVQHKDVISDGPKWWGPRFRHTQEEVFPIQEMTQKVYHHIYRGLKSDLHTFELKQLITSKGFQASNLLILGKIMSQENAGENGTDVKPLSKPATSPQEQPQPPVADQRIVQVKELKKKINVIEIQDSEEEHPKVTKILRSKERSTMPNSPKKKKMTLKCMICREAGKKTSMKACLDCKGYSHIACLQQQNEQVSRHICRRCRHKRHQRLGMRKLEKTNFDEKMTAKRVERQKKKEQQLKKMEEFQQRYPYYLQEEKVRFPIEDKLLFIYKELFEISETPRPKPICHSIIPTELLGDFLQIENFFSTFQEELVAFGTLPSVMNKNIIYFSMSGRGFDGIFCGMLEALLNVYLCDIFEKNKTDNVKTLNDHAFFTLMIHLHENEELSQQLLVRAAKEVMRYLATVPSMKQAFEELEFPEDIDLITKVRLIVGLIKGLSEIDEFHELVSIKSEKIQVLTKQKTELIAQLKVDEAENLSNNEKLKDMTEEGKKMEETHEGVTRLITKELDKHKKKMVKLVSQQTKSEETIKEIRTKIGQISRVMPFLTSEMLFLGRDRNESEYFFYLREPNKIYVKYRAYLLDSNENYYIYERKETIIELLKTLNTKGLKEKHLHENIQSLLKDEIITNDVPLDDGSNFMLEEQKYREIKFQNIVTAIKQIEATFTTYLTVKQYQWASETYRELFIRQLDQIDDLHILKENLRAMQESFLFAQYATADTLRKRMDDSDEDIEMREEAREGRKKIPIRLWGINSEKTKKYWCEYLEESIDVYGVWICTYILRNTVDKYVKKKMEAYYDQQARDRKQKIKERQNAKQNGNRLIRLTRQSDERVESRTQNKSKTIREQSSSDVVSSRRPNLRARKHKKMNIESDVEVEPNYQQISESSSNEDCCQICGDFGEMICCDTCPKVYHTGCLKMSDVPEGEWSCFKCLEKMANQRQTRSRAKIMNRYI